jgi:hypothetical protein
MRWAAFLIILMTEAWSSPPPCTAWQVKVRTHPVQKYKRADGTDYSKAGRDEHCRDKFPKVTQWQNRFVDTAPPGWPEIDEKFKPWSQAEKELVMKALSIQPLALRNLKTLIARGTRSSKSRNPGTAVKNLNTVALYDEFFSSGEQLRILTHELSHLYLHELELDKLGRLATEIGWRDPGKGPLVRRKEIVLLRPDSGQSFTEDVANHLEDYFHDRKNLCQKFPRRCEMIRHLVGSDFDTETK